MEIINIRWDSSECMCCGPVGSENVIEVAYGDEKDVVFVFIANIADCYNVLVTTHSIYDLDRYVLQNQDSEGILLGKIEKVTIEKHEMMLECDEEEEEMFAKIDSKYKDIILKTSNIMSDLLCESTEETIDELIEKYNQD